MKRNKTLTK